MSVTSIPFGHALARKVFGAALFAEMVKRPGFSTAMTGAAPQVGEAKTKLERMQTSPDMPFVRVTDLQKGAGDLVTVDLFNILQGKPVMGDRKLSGRMMSLTSSTAEVRIDQMRGGVDTGGRMTQQRTVHNLRTIGLAGLAGWYARAVDQIKLIHCAGARGSSSTKEWVVPLASDPEFTDIVVNSVRAPTRNRFYVAGMNTDHSTMDATDYLRLETIDYLKVMAVDEAIVPLQPIKMKGDEDNWDYNPLYVLWVTPRQMYYLQTLTSDRDWRKALEQAHVRGAKNPLFKGTDTVLWNGILVKKLPYSVRFNPGDVVTIADPAQAVYTETTSTIPAFGGAAGAAVDRAILMGAQGLAMAYGKHSASGQHFSWHEEMTDHGNTVEASVSTIGGCNKLMFRDADGEDFDHGFAVIDSYAPDPAVTVVP